MLNADRLRVLIVGAGAVGLRRTRSLLAAGVSRITVVAPEIHAEMPAAVQRQIRGFEPADVAGHNLVIAATNQREINETVADACERAGVWCCRADDGAEGDFIVPAVVREGPIVVAVSAGAPAMTKELAGEIRKSVTPMVDAATQAEQQRRK